MLIGRRSREKTSLNTEFLPKRGEVWRVQLNPTTGAEMGKTRPALVLSSDALGRLPVKLVAPITGWKQSFERNQWHVLIEPDEMNGLKKRSAVDALQLRSLYISRFQERMGRVAADMMEEVAFAVGLVVEMP